MKLIACIVAGALSGAAWGQVAPASAPSAPNQPGRPSPAAAEQTGSQTKPASQPATHRPIQEILDERVPEVNFRDVPLESVMDWVELQSGAMVYVRWAVLADVGIERDTPITVKARGRKLSQILWVILNEAAGSTGVTLAYQATDELLMVSTDKDLSRNLVTRAYEVLDTARDVPNFERCQRIIYRTRVTRGAAPRPPATGTNGMVSTARPSAKIETDDEKLQEFMELIHCTIEPDSWDVNGGEGTIFPHKGRLIIRTSIRVHRLIENAFKQ